MSLEEEKKNLIGQLKDIGYLKTPAVIKAFLETRREDFIPSENRKLAYADEPLPIRNGQTISAPHMVALMTELLEPKKTDKILEVGSGSGYQAAILCRLAGKVITIELEPELAVFAEGNLKKAGCGNVKVLCADGSLGYAKEQPFDKIIVTCGCEEIPKPLVEQLKEGGIIIAPVGSAWHKELIAARKVNGELQEKSYGSVAFVPLRH
jgi:protein-L-isoaspartate(D-aspartate) O-methyltransferase